MRTKSKPHAQADKDPSLDMSSMIDVSFLLLIFFLLTSTLDPKEGDLGMTLPGDLKMHPGERLDVDEMHITIEANGNIIVDNNTLDTDINHRSLPLLNDKLQQYKAATDLTSSEPLVLVEASNDVAGQRFVDVLNALAKVNIKNISIVDMSKR